MKILNLIGIFNVLEVDADKTKYAVEWETRITKDVGNTLKGGKTFTDEQKEWMFWYNYFFLNI